MVLFFAMVVRTGSGPVTIFFLLFLVVFVLVLFLVPFSGLGVSPESIFAPHYIIDSIAWRSQTIKIKTKASIISDYLL